MQFIEKSHTEPINWSTFFVATDGSRSYKYLHLRFPADLKRILIEEQNSLCAYCQCNITIETSSIEHFIPQSQNDYLSTNYHNLIAVCKDKKGKGYCEEVRGNTLLPPIIFYNDSQVNRLVLAPFYKNHSYFSCYQDGTIVSRRSSSNLDVKNQAEAFINILNLNNYILKRTRADIIKKIIDAALLLPPNQRTLFYERQLVRLLNTPNQPYRQFLLIYFASKMSIN